MTTDYNDLLDSVEKQFRLTQTTTDMEARRSSYLSTGLLTTDLILGGGLLPGAWYTIYGQEQSAKSTSTLHIMKSACNYDIPIILSFDFEGSSDPIYTQNILNTLGEGLTLDEMFGKKNGKGKWIVKPRVRLYTESVAETFFDSMASLFRALPDKLFVDGQWYLVYERTKANISAYSKIADKQLSQSTGALYVKTDNPYPQALVFVDSYPMMFPDRLDEDGKGAGMASTARMFSENMPKVASKLKRKAITIVGVNQLRLRPAVMFGNPEYEPAGETVKYISSARLKNTPRAVPKDYVPGGKGQLHEETSVHNEDAVDTYRYIHQFTFKNKTFSASLEGWQRIWVRDHDGVAHGFCPVFDLYMYLMYTGQLVGNMKSMDITTDFGFNAEGITYYDLKSLVLLSGDEQKDYAKSLGLGKEVITLRENCFAQIRSGKAHELYFDNAEDDDEGEDVEEDEDDE